MIKSEKMNEELKTIYNMALSKYGVIAQQWMIIEECGELLTAIARLKRNRSQKEDVITELADVHIMVEQLALFYGLDDFIQEKNRKLRRLIERLNKQ